MKRKGNSEVKQIFGCMVDIVKDIRARKRSDMFKGELQNLTSAQVHIMHYLYEKGKGTMSELSEYAKVQMPSMTDNVNKLVEQGLASREHSVADRRSVTVSITKKGKKIISGHMKASMNHLERLFGNMTIEEKHRILELLQYIKTSLERI